MRLAELSPNMRIRAAADRGPKDSECWKHGDEFVVRKTGAGELAIECRHSALFGVHPLRTDAETAEFEVLP